MEKLWQKESQLEELKAKNEKAKDQVRKLKDDFEKQMLMQKKDQSRLRELEAKEDAKQQIIKDQIQKIEGQNALSMAQA